MDINDTERPRSHDRDRLVNTFKALFNHLVAVENGFLKVYPKLDWRSCSSEAFFTNADWHFGFFDDNSSWDYLDWATPPRGSHDMIPLTYDDINGTILWEDDDEYCTAKCSLMNYQPSDEAWESIYQKGLEAAWRHRQESLRAKAGG